jgi:hypothetical protein
LTFDFSLAASACVWHKSHFASVLYGTGDEALFLNRNTGDTTSADLAAV